MRTLSSKWQSMTMQQKVVLTVVTLLLVMFIILYAVFYNGMGRMLNEREANNILNEAVQTKNVLRSSNNYLSTVLDDWAAYGYTYDFVQGNMPEYIDYYLEGAFLYDNYNLDFVTYLNLSGEIVYERFYPDESPVLALQAVYQRLGAMALKTFDQEATLDEQSKARLITSGFLLADGQLIYIAAHPVLQTNFAGPATGTLLFGRIISQGELDSLKSDLNVNLAITPKTNVPFSANQEEELAKNSTVVSVTGSNQLTAYTLFQDIWEDGQLVLSLSGPRELYRQGERIMFTVLAIIALCCAVLLVMFLRFLRSVIVKPLGQLVKEVKEIDLDTIHPISTQNMNNREFGILVSTVNDLLSRIDTDRNTIKENNDKLFYHANFDMLTGLPNRVNCQGVLEEAIKAANRRDSRIGVFLIELDRFEFINYTMGRAAGDQFIIAVGRRLKTYLGGEVTVGHLDGDAFVVIVEGLEHEDEARTYADQMQVLFEESFAMKDWVMFITASIGFSIFPNDGGDVVSLFQKAEMAMFRAKDLGGKMGYRYEPWLEKALQQKMLVENNIRAAIKDDFRQFQMYFQPKAQLDTGNIEGCEALMRWKTPEGMISPGEFIPQAEESGLIVPLSQWAVNEACRCAKLFEEKGIHNRVSVNISAQVLLQKDFLEMVETAAEENGVAPSKLDIEITEATLIEDIKQANAILDALHAMGITVSIDDFGTGCSSLSYLKKLSVDRIKIDRSFIVGLNGQEGRTIVNAIVAMAKSLRLVVTAEGVEDEAQYNYLKGIGCEEIQGYYVSKPVPLDEYLQFISQRGDQEPPLFPEYLSLLPK